MKLIKSHTYNVINDEPFSIPLPASFELWHGNILLVSYSINENKDITYTNNKNTEIKPITNTYRKLEMRDIYFLFSSRVFAEKTPYTEFELKRFGLKDYNPYQICLKTHGILPVDNYWIKFPRENISYKDALADIARYYNPETKKKGNNTEEKNSSDNSEKNVDEQLNDMLELSEEELLRILSQKTINFDELSAKHKQGD